jgi:hypothetical protein
VNVEVAGRVQELRDEAERLRAQAIDFEAQGLSMAAAVCRFEAFRNDNEAVLEGGDGEVQTVTEQAIGIVTLTPAERTVPWWLPVAALVALLIVAAGLGLLAAHVAKGGL